MITDDDDFQRGCQLAEQGKFLEATNSFSRLSTDSERYGQAQYLLGCALNHLGRFESYRESFEAFARAKRSFRENKLKIPLNFYYQQAFAQFHCGEYFQAVQTITLFIHKAEEEEEERYPGYLTRAQIYAHLHYYEQALDDLNEINRNENRRTILSVLLHGRILSLLHRFDEAKEYFEMALRWKTDEKGNDFHFGLIHSELGDYSQAMEHYQSATVGSDVDRAELYFRQGLIHHLSNEFDEAKTKYLAALECNPEHSRTLLHLARLYREEKNVTEALKSLKTAHACSPYDREVLDELSSIHREQNQRRLALFYQSESLKIDEIDLTNLVLNDDDNEEEEEAEEEEEKEEIVPRRVLHPSLIWSLEQESNLPISENRLVLYQQIRGSYAAAIESDESPESRIFLALCQESENDFIQCYSSMKEFYRQMRENPRAKENWQIFSRELDEDVQSGNISSSLMMLRYGALKRVELLRREMEQDDQELESNRKLFYEQFQDHLIQCFIALSIAGRNATVRSENLKGPMNTIRWLVEYLSLDKVYLPTIRSKLKFKNKFENVQEKCSLFSEMGDVTDFYTLAREIARTVVDRYATQLSQIYNSGPPIERLAEFLLKFLVETIRDKDLNLSKNPRTKLSDVREMFLRWISVAKSNSPPGIFPWRKDPFDNDLPLRSTNVWSSNEVFRSPAIRLPDGTTFRDAPWINERKYGHRLGTEDDIRFIKTFL